MKLDPHLPQLPSIGELLEHPRVKGVVERINRSTLAQRATGFLDELRGSLAAKTGAEIPSVAHLAERLARRLLGEPAATGSVINATGVVLGEPGLAPPLAERSLHTVFQVASEYQRHDDQAQKSIERGVAELLGAEAALLTRSFETALVLALAATAPRRDAYVCGAASRAADDFVDWQRLAALSGVVVREVESPASVTRQAGEAGRGISALVRAPDVDEGASLEIMAKTARELDANLIDVAPVAGAIDPAAYGYQTIESIAQRIAAGADLVVADGAGLLGGPACGLIVGRRRLVDAAVYHHLASLVAIDRLTAAALSAVVEAYREDASSVVFQLPVWQLLSAPLDNLRQRAERLAPQMGESPTLAAAHSREVESVWRRQGSREWRAASWAILLTPKHGELHRLRTDLARATYPIIARIEDNSVVIDLRATFPRWDQQLVAAVIAAAG